MGADQPAYIIEYLRRANDVARTAVDAGRHPFGCIIVAGDDCTVLAEQGNIDTLEHAEAAAVRQVWKSLAPDALWRCTLYSTVEPCAMCAGAAYWANIGRIVFGIAESELRNLTGADPRNPTLNLPCRSVFSAGTKPIEVIGPVEAVREEILSIHRRFWPGLDDESPDR